MAKKITWDRVIKNALLIYAHADQYTYCLEGCGELAESDRIKNLYNWYYWNGYAAKMGMTYDEWLKINHGKRCFDCSGFLDYCIFQNIGYRPYSSWSFGEMPKNESIVAGPAASILWKKGHVALDIGYGFQVSFENWNRTCEFKKISEYVWTSSHLANDIDYAGADSR